MQEKTPSDRVKIAICDDEILLLPQLEAIIKNAFQEKKLNPDIKTFSSASDLLNYLYNQDLLAVYFLDIDIPEQNGISLAQKIKAKDPDAMIVYVSAKEEMVYETFRTQPLAFVRKSNFSEDMKSAIQTLTSRMQKPPEKNITFYDELNHTIALNVSRILYVEAKEKYQDIISIDGHRMIRCSISDLERALSPYYFYRIHRGYLVNFQYIYRIDSSAIVLDDGQKLPLSRQRKKEFLRLFQEYISKTRKN